MLDGLAEVAACRARSGMPRRDERELLPHGRFRGRPGACSHGHESTGAAVLRCAWLAHDLRCGRACFHAPWPCVDANTQSVSGEKDKGCSRPSLNETRTAAM